MLDFIFHCCFTRLSWSEKGLLNLLVSPAPGMPTEPKLRHYFFHLGIITPFLSFAPTADYCYVKRKTNFPLYFRIFFQPASLFFTYMEKKGSRCQFIYILYND